MLKVQMQLPVAIKLTPHPEGEGEQDLNSIMAYVFRWICPEAKLTLWVSRKACYRDRDRRQDHQ
jgi:hypothetical protein